MTHAQNIDLARLLSPDARRTPEMEALWQWIVAEDAKDPDTARVLTAQEHRALSARLNRRWNVDLPEMAQMETLDIPGLAGAPAMRARMFTPPDARPGCIFFIHGGGWVICSIETHEQMIRLLAQEARTRVLAIDYRLAPEHPFPAGLEDCQAAWRWLAAQGARTPGLDGPLAIAGDSAGANLALGTIMRESELKRRIPDAGLLFYGVFSSDLDSPSHRRFSTGYGLTQEGMSAFFDYYAPGTGPDSARHETLVQPLAAAEAVLARLPPLFLNAAGLDVLLCDSLNFVDRLRQAGARHEFVLHEGVHHGFMQFTLKLEEARRAVKLAADYFTRVLR